MDPLVVLLGLMLGIVVVLGKSKSAQERTQQLRLQEPAPQAPPSRQVPPAPRLVPPTPPTIVLPPLVQRGSREDLSTNAILDAWRKSIVGLIKLAERNLKYADECLKVGEYKRAVEAALTSIENASRALLHSYGEKPEDGPGQQETLKLLSRRFKGTESVDFEKAIEEITQLRCNCNVEECLQTRSLSTIFGLSKAEPSAILDSASRIVALFTQIIEAHFATEIPELGETCPKCHALDLDARIFDATSTNCTCKKCGHSWSEPRNS
jgi:uncharacterized protein (UPF0332 family)